MKRVIIVLMLGITLVACGGANKNHNKSDKQAPSSQTMGSTQTQTNDAEQADIIKMRVNDYSEMAVSALENSDAQKFMEIMSEFDAWVNSLDASEQQRVKELRDEWNAANAERLANVKQQATMLNPHTGVEGQTSERM